MAGNAVIITTGTVMLNGADFSDQVFEARIVRTRETVEVPAVFSTGRKEQRAGAVSNELQLHFYNDHALSTLWALTWDQIDDADGEVSFECRFMPGVASATNPKFTGTVVITSGSAGGASGSLSENTVTFPIKGAITKVIV